MRGSKRAWWKKGRERERDCQRKAEKNGDAKMKVTCLREWLEGVYIIRRITERRRKRERERERERKRERMSSSPFFSFDLYEAVNYGSIVRRKPIQYFFRKIPIAISQRQ